MPDRTRSGDIVAFLPISDTNLDYFDAGKAALFGEAFLNFGQTVERLYRLRSGQFILRRSEEVENEEGIPEWIDGDGSAHEIPEEQAIGWMIKNRLTPPGITVAELREMGAGGEWLDWMESWADGCPGAAGIEDYLEAYLPAARVLELFKDKIRTHKELQKIIDAGRIATWRPPAESTGKPRSRRRDVHIVQLAKYLVETGSRRELGDFPASVADEVRETESSIAKAKERKAKGLSI